MKVLFVCSGNSKYHNVMPAFLKTQADSLDEVGVKLDVFQIRGKGIKGYVKNIYPLRKVILKGKYDIVHAHYGFSGIVAALAKKRKNKLIVSFMGESELSYDVESGRENRLMAHIMPFLDKLFAKYFFDWVIFKSESIHRHLNNIKHFTILPNGVNIDIFKPIDKEEARKQLNLPLDKKIVLWIGNKDRLVKGYYLADKVYNVLKREFHDVELLLIDKVDNSLLPYYYNAADVFLLTSLTEGSPNVVKEAMACNCPIVATNVGDVEWVIGNTQGCYVSDINEENLLMGLHNVLQSDYIHFRTNGRERLQMLQLSSQEVADKLNKIYIDLTK